MGVCGMIVLGSSPEQMSMILAGAAAGEEIIIHTLEAMEVGMLMLLAFLTCKEHLFWILFLSFDMTSFLDNCCRHDVEPFINV